MDGAPARGEAAPARAEILVETGRPVEAPSAPVTAEAVEPVALVAPVAPVAPQAPAAAAAAAPEAAAVEALSPLLAVAAAAPRQQVALAMAARPVPAQGPAPRTDVDGDESRPTCTVAQLRRFIKSRPWIPMHELRRRFGIYGGDDDVSPLRVGEHMLFIGLPPAEARIMAELLGGGDVGFELSLDPVTPIVVGVYPMRPVPRG